MFAHGADREALTPVAAPRRQKMRKTPTPPKMKAPARCLGRTAARTPQTAKMVPPAPVEGAAALLADFDRYLGQDHIDLRRDGAGYRMAGLWMTDEELNELIRGFVSLLQPYMANPATPDRRRRILRTIVLPAPDPTPTEDRKGS